MNCRVLVCFVRQSSGFYEALGSLDWHLLSGQHQRTYLFLLQHAKQPSIFYLVGIVPVNMETFLGVT